MDVKRALSSSFPCKPVPECRDLLEFLLQPKDDGGGTCDNTALKHVQIIGLVRSALPSVVMQAKCHPAVQPTVQNYGNLKKNSS